MPSNAQVSVTTTPTVLVAVTNFDQTVWLHNSGGGVVYIGDSSVSSTNGYKLDNNDKMQLLVGDHEGLWGITASGTNVVCVLKQIN